MSVERIAPLGQTTMDPPSTMRPVTGPVFDHGRTSRAPFGSSAPEEGPSHLFDSLVLPLPTLEGEAGGPAPARVSALYREAAVGGAVVALTDGRLPDATLRHAVETLLTDLAETRQIPVSELIARTERIAPALLPSHNDAKAQFTLKGRLTASDAVGKLRPLDLYLTRISASEWEAAVFERTPARAASLFPRPTPLVDVHRLVIDPETALVRACVPWGSPQNISRDERPRPSGLRQYLLVAAATLGAAALATFFARGLSSGPSLLLITALAMALAAI